MSSSNCCFLTCIQISQESSKVVWYSHLFQNFPQYIVIHTVKGFGIVNKAEIDIFLEFSWFFNDPMPPANLSSPENSDISIGSYPKLLKDGGVEGCTLIFSLSLIDTVKWFSREIVPFPQEV